MGSRAITQFRPLPLNLSSIALKVFEADLALGITRAQYARIRTWLQVVKLWFKRSESSAYVTFFSVSGNQVLPIYDAASDNGLRILHMRHESACAFAAAGAAELTSRPGVILTSAGPAFLAALTGVGAVRAMELPLLFLSGSSPIQNSGFGNFQELDQSFVASRTICKGSLPVSSVESIPQVIRDAWHLAMDGIPGPVHISLPADVLLRKASVTSQPLTPHAPAVTHDNRALDEIAALLVAAERPLIIVRPSAARSRTGELVHRLASQLRIAPVITGPPRALADSKYLHIAPHYKKSDCALVIAPSDYALGFLDESVIAGKGKLIVIDAPGDPPLRRTPTIHTQALPHMQSNISFVRPRAEADAIRSGRCFGVIGPQPTSRLRQRRTRCIRWR